MRLGMLGTTAIILAVLALPVWGDDPGEYPAPALPRASLAPRAPLRPQQPLSAPTPRAANSATQPQPLPYQNQPRTESTLCAQSVSAKTFQASASGGVSEADCGCGGRHGTDFTFGRAPGPGEDFSQGVAPYSVSPYSVTPTHNVGAAYNGAATPCVQCGVAHGVTQNQVATASAATPCVRCGVAHGDGAACGRGMAMGDARSCMRCGTAHGRGVACERSRLFGDRQWGSPLLGGNGSATTCDECGESFSGSVGCGCPCWTFGLDGLLMQRSSVGPFDFGFEPGLQVRAIRHAIFGSPYDLDLGYMTMGTWTDAVGGETYRSELDSFEFGVRRRLTERFTLLGGLRWVQVDEGYVGLVNTISTANDLYGAQVGGDLLLWNQGGPFRLDMIGKMGVYAAETAATFNGVLTEESTTAFLGELGFLGTYQWTDNLAFRGGYQMMWIDGIATAFGQTAAGTVNTSGSPFYHGALFGAEYCW